MWKLKITPTSVFAFYCIDKPILKRDINFRKKPEKTDLSLNSARKMKRALQWLIACSDWKTVYEKKFQKLVSWRVNHVCLTFHENMKDDNKARAILSSWLEVAKYRWNVRQYVWKAEPQQRGAIHFHLSTNVYIPHAELKYTWNRALRKHKLNNIEDNSTDVHAVVEENDLLSYFSDYLVDKEKHEGRRKISGRLWSCSHDLTEAGKEYIPLDDQEAGALENDLQKYSLRDRLINKGCEIPPFLNFVNYWIIPPDQLKGEISNLYQSELLKLKLPAPKYNLEFWEDNSAAKLFPAKI